jgi:hypothetical protein
MIMENYIKKECSVHLVASDTITNIRRFNVDGRILLQHMGLNIDGGESVRVEFRDGEKVLATSDQKDDYPQIGLDFMWGYPERFDKIKSVYLYFHKKNWKEGVVKLRSNGDVHVSPCDEKEYTEKDVIMMLSYAVAHDKITSSEMKTKVDEVLNWFKS